MSLKIIKAGLLDTVQDLGRFGYQYKGINPGGVMDRFSAQVANLLVGNDLHEPVIEMHFPAAELLFQSAALIAITGADFQPNVNNEPVSLNQPILVNAGSQLKFGKKLLGERAYLAIKGLKVSQWLNSASTNLTAGAGGVSGRALKKNDTVQTGLTNYAGQLKETPFTALPFKADTTINMEREVFVLPGREWDLLEAADREIFLSTGFTISKSANRMGYRLEGNPIKILMKEELVSTGVSFGTIQLLPNGQLIILMADHQSTGGYPRLAHVIRVHAGKLAQTGPGGKIHFKLVDQQVAEQLLLREEQHLLQLKNACKFRLTEFF